MKKYDWVRDGVEHLERKGCIINIVEGLSDEKGQLTVIEVIGDQCKARYVHVYHTGEFKKVLK